MELVRPSVLFLFLFLRPSVLRKSPPEETEEGSKTKTSRGRRDTSENTKQELLPKRNINIKKFQLDFANVIINFTAAILSESCDLVI